jgi:hypothetical protein
MRTLFTIRGFGADGRILGLGLAAAMDKQRREAARDVEAYLRRGTDDRAVTTASV